MSDSNTDNKPSLLLPLVGIAIVSGLIGATIARVNKGPKNAAAKSTQVKASEAKTQAVTEEQNFTIQASEEDGVAYEIVVPGGIPEENGVIILDEIADFSMETSFGEPISRETMKGKFWVADFIFTRCSGPCPAMTEQMKALQSEMPDRDDLKLVTFTIDPDFDTPAILKKYAKDKGADPGRWLFARGTFYDTQRFAKESLKIGVDRDGAWVDPVAEEVVEEPTEQQIESGNVQYKVTEFVHSQKFVLIDNKGRIRGYYDGETPEAVGKILEDLTAILPAAAAGENAG